MFGNRPKIDLGRLAALQDRMQRDRVEHEHADNAVRECRSEIRKRFTRRTEIENLPPLVENREEQKKRFQSCQALTSEMEALKEALPQAEADRDAAAERMRASEMLWERCSRHAGVR